MRDIRRLQVARIRLVYHRRRYMSPLSAREREVLQLIAAGCTTKEIAKTLGIAFKTAAAHRAHILDKTDTVNAADLIHQAERNGWLENERAKSPAAEQARPSFDSMKRRLGVVRRENQRARSDLAKTIARLLMLREATKREREALTEARNQIAHRLQALLQTSRFSPRTFAAPPPEVRDIWAAGAQCPVADGAPGRL